MAEIKHTFTTGRMNKDLDERLIPNGEYRDASNIQVRTTDGSDAGAVQNIEGNEEVGVIDVIGVDGMKCIGSVPSDKTGNSYFLMTSTGEHKGVELVNYESMSPTAGDESYWSNYGQLVCTPNSVASTSMSQLFSQGAGKTFEIEVEVLHIWGTASIDVWVGGTDDINKTPTITEMGTYTFLVESGSGGTFGSTVYVSDNGSSAVYSISVKEKPAETRLVDLIVEHTQEGLTLPVVTDVYSIIESYSNVGSPSPEANYTSFNVSDGSKYRVGMTLKVYNSRGGNLLQDGTKVSKVVGNTVYLNKAQPIPFLDEKIPNNDFSNKGGEVLQNDDFGVYESSSAFGIAFPGWNHGNSSSQDGSFTLSSIEGGFKHTIGTPPSSSSNNWHHRTRQNVGYQGSGDVSEVMKIDKYYEVTFDIRSDYATSFRFNVAQPTSLNVNTDEIFQTAGNGEWETKVYNFQCKYNDSDQTLQFWDNSAHNRTSGMWHEIRNVSFKEVGSGWVYDTGQPNNPLSFYDDKLKITTKNIGTYVDRFHTVAYILKPDTEYTLTYNINSASGINGFQWWDGNAYHDGAYTAGSTHKYTFTSPSGTLTTQRPHFKVEGTNTMSNMVFNHVSLVEDDTIAQEFRWEADRVLDFDKDNLITGLNVIDNLLAWTCNTSEPRRINIDRCKAGTKDFTTHTDLYLSTPGGLVSESTMTTELSPNLIVNSNFDLDVSGWLPVDCDLTRTVDGKGRLTIGNGTSNFIQSGDGEFLNLEIGEYYEFSLDCDINTADNAFISIGQATYNDSKNKYEYAFTHSLRSNVDDNMSIAFKATTNKAKARVYVKGEIGNYIDIDNLSLRKTKILNGSHNGWVGHGGWSLSNNIASNNGAGSTLVLRALTIGEKYTIKVKASSFTSGEFSVFLGVGSNSSKFTGTDEFTYTAVATGDEYARIKSHSGIGSFSIADISITKASDSIGTPLAIEHTTVIKPGPKSAPKIKLQERSRDSFSSTSINYSGFTTSEGTPLAANFTGTFQDVLSEGLDVRVDDILVLSSYKSNSVVELLITNKEPHYTMETDSITGDYYKGEVSGINMDYKILKISPSTNSSDNLWEVVLQEKSKGIFENEFPRFAYRYKYNDNEYSVFSPWSEVAFLPGEFTYNTTEGYNLAMSNTVRKIELSNLNDNGLIPKDVDSVDILFKSSDSPTVYIVKSISKGVDLEFTNGSIDITTDMVHLVVPSDKILNAWDNVPTRAQAQDIVGNRIVYGNYTQGYDIPFKPTIQQSIISHSTPMPHAPEKSIKSMRSYKTGVVFGDKFGRETAVISMGSKSFNSSTLIGGESDDTIIPKSNASKRNVIQVKQNWASDFHSTVEPSDWMSYAKYYIKESGGNYYNLPMDNWYDSEDGNIWISFSSSDKNKITKESVLHLKNNNGKNTSSDNDTEYKVLSIANEAPSFIKTKNVRLDDVLVSTDYYNNDGNGNLWLLMNSLNLIIDSEDYAEAFHDNKPPEFKGRSKVRAIAVSNDGAILAFSRFANIVNFKSSTGVHGSNASGHITIDKPLGDSADFFNILVGRGIYDTLSEAEADLNIDGIRFEIFDSIEENRPEFEGRFFVKINKDHAIETDVTGTISKSTDYEVEGSMTLRHVNTSIVSSAVNGPHKTYQWGFWNASGTLNDVNQVSIGSNPWQTSVNELLGNFASCGYGSLTKDWWVWFKRACDYNASNEVNLFIDQAAYFDSTSVSDNENDPGFDGRITQELSNWLKNKPEGLSTSPTCVDGLDSISFGTTVNEWDSLHNYKDNLQLGRLRTIGSVFSFTDDPNSVKYKVRKVIDTKYFNYSDSTCQRCESQVESNNTYQGSTGSYYYPSCERNGFKVYIDRIDENGAVLHNKGIDIDQFDPRGTMHHDGSSHSSLTFYKTKTIITLDDTPKSSEPSIWETKVTKDIDQGLYYEASNAIPMVLNNSNVRSFIPTDAMVKLNGRFAKVKFSDGEIEMEYKQSFPKRDGVGQVSYPVDATGNAIRLENLAGESVNGIIVGDILIFEHSDGTKTRTRVLDYGDLSTGTFISDGEGFKDSAVNYTEGTNQVTGVDIHADLKVGMVVEGVEGHFRRGTTITDINSSTITISEKVLVTAASKPIVFHKYSGSFLIDSNVYKYAVDLPWSNCFSFGNGVESDRIRDDFNQPTIGSGFKVSTTLNDYGREDKYSSLIFSGLYNSTSSLNNLSEFNMGSLEGSITKDLNPSYGVIQALDTNNSNLNVFTEDKVLKVLVNKDALYNADGNRSLISSPNVLGQAIPFVGDYGVSKNPESIVRDQYRTYFADKQRGAVLRLSNDGITPISSIGMKAWFRDNLKNSEELIGSYDIVNGEYNLTIKPTAESQELSKTITFNERSKGWVSFKSFIQDSGLSVNGRYLTIKDNKIWQHYSDNVNRNTFYGVYSPSTLTAVINDMPSVVKNFKTINYEGSEGRSININNQTVVDSGGNSLVVNDNTYNTLAGEPTSGYGWNADVVTDLQDGLVVSFVNKEGKWFGNIVGNQKSFSDLESLDVKEQDITTQGVGLIKSVADGDQTHVDITIEE